MYFIIIIHTAMYNSSAVSTRAHQISTDPLCIPSKMSFNVLYNINHMQLQLASLYIYIIMRVYSYLLMVTVAMLVGVAGNTVLINHAHHLAYRVCSHALAGLSLFLFIPQVFHLGWPWIQKQPVIHLPSVATLMRPCQAKIS